MPENWISARCHGQAQLRPVDPSIAYPRPRLRPGASTHAAGGAVPADGPLEERLWITGCGRHLEGLLTYLQGGVPRFSALIAPPHPLFGGDAQNNLVRALGTGLALDRGLTLTFNYAGSGASEGGLTHGAHALSRFWEHGSIENEQDWVSDTRSAAGALRAFGERALVLIGYSFGCWAVSQCLPTADPCAVVLISPHPKRHGFESLGRSAAPLLVIASDEDFICTVAELVRWYDGLRHPKSLVVLKAGEHFFRGSEHRVLDAVTDFLRRTGVVS